MLEYDRLLGEDIQGPKSIRCQLSSLRRENRLLKVGLTVCIILAALPYLIGFQPELSR